jgi:hypothetical protein
LICSIHPIADKIGFMKKLIRVSTPVLSWIALLTVLTTVAASDAAASSRSSKRIGVGIGLITEPFPSLLGYTLAYNLSNKFRVTGGYGSVSATGSNFNLDVKTYGLNLKYFPLDWNFAPFFEGGASSVSGNVTGTGTVSGLSIASTGIFYSAGCGLDWQTGIGFNIGLSYKLLFGKNADNVAAPGFHLGWFF